ncbi:TPA: tetratricopeptide repeat protein [Candidatus Poribacteria bacterium]|nr:tetratricopeptide repeat protein [Candidatus Poribacteria bacterium]
MIKMLIRKAIITIAIIFLFFGCARFQPKPLEKKDEQQLPMPTIELKQQEAPKKVTPKMIEEYAMVHQISDMKVAEFYLTHPDYAKANPYIPTSEDLAYYESKFLERMYPNFRKEVEKDGFDKARSRYMNLDPNRDSGDKDSQITVDKVNKLNESVDKEFKNALVLYEKGLIDEAIEKMRSVVANKPESPTFVYNLGVIYLKKEDVRQAMACFQKTIELLEESSYTEINKIVYPRIYMGACINLGMIYNYLGLYNEAIEVLTKAIKFSPKDYDANWNLAVTYYTMNDYNRAILQLKKCIEIDPKNDQIHNAVGVAYYKMGLYSMALEEFRTAIKLNPNENQYNYNEGLTLARLNQYENAMMAFRKANEMKDANDMYRILSEQNKLNKAKEMYNKGCLAMESNKIDEAISAFNSALEIKPDMVEALFNLGNCYRIKRDIQKQIYYFEESAKLNPDLLNLYYNLGLAYIDAGMYLNARYALEKAVEDNPTFKDAHFSLGRVYYKDGRYADSCKEFMKCLELSPNWFPAVINLGNCYLKLGDIENAISQFKQATLLSPKSAEAHYDLGIAFTKAKRYNEAIESFQKAISFDPAHAESIRMLKELEDFKKANK